VNGYYLVVSLAGGIIGGAIGANMADPLTRAFAEGSLRATGASIPMHASIAGGGSAGMSEREHRDAMRPKDEVSRLEDAIFEADQELAELPRTMTMANELGMRWFRRSWTIAWAKADRAIAWTLEAPGHELTDAAHPSMPSPATRVAPLPRSAGFRASPIASAGLQDSRRETAISHSCVRRPACLDRLDRLDRGKVVPSVGDKRGAPT